MRMTSDMHGSPPDNRDTLSATDDAGDYYRDKSRWTVAEMLSVALAWLAALVAMGGVLLLACLREAGRH